MSTSLAAHWPQLRAAGAGRRLIAGGAMGSMLPAGPVTRDGSGCGARRCDALAGLRPEATRGSS